GYRTTTHNRQLEKCGQSEKTRPCIRAYVGKTASDCGLRAKKNNLQKHASSIHGINPIHLRQAQSDMF
ncbi:hypothetical protein, partial [Komagataeibacter xylinus]|uniref:hypothetical protein n=1 Tax=Komagataeibacter xylinus TaxID=28448 RepID=UPI00223080DB